MQVEGTILASGLLVSYSETGNSGQDSAVSCLDFSSQVQLATADALQIGGYTFSGRPRGRRLGKDSPPTTQQVFDGLKDHCRAAVESQAERQPKVVSIQRAEADARAQAEEEAVRASEAAAAKAAAEAETRRLQQRRTSLLTVVRAAQEPDPFASIRGDYDLGATVSGRWRTTYSLPGAEECGLVKTAPASATLWAYGCSSHSYPSYEDAVKSLSTDLGLSIQPDLGAVGRNQVYFADPTQPGWRLYAARLDDKTVSITVFAIRPVNAAFPESPVEGASVSTGGSGSEAGGPRLDTGSVHDEVERIRAGRYSPLPRAELSHAGPGTGGRTLVAIKNSTAYELSVFLDGPSATRVKLAVGEAREIEVAPGLLHLAGRVSSEDVLPFYGEENYERSTRYSMNFYIKQRQLSSAAWARGPVT
jgi:hypothetical protein